MTAIKHLGLFLALGTLTVPVLAQAEGDVPVLSQDHRIMLRYGIFDPAAQVPQVPATLEAGADTNLWIVQFHNSPTDLDRDAVRTQGGRLIYALPHDGQIVKMTAATAAAVAVLPQVRWVGPYQPAYRLEKELLAEHLSGREMPVRKYNLVMGQKRTEKAALEEKVLAIGGRIIDRNPNSILFTVELTGAQLLQVVRFDEVLYVDRWTPSGVDMDNARTVQGSNTIETLAGYTGSGVRGHVYEGVEFNHPDFTTAMTNVLSGGQSQAHGHCTAGCIFGNGTSAAQARGHAPDAIGFYTNYSTVNAGVSRNDVINAVVNTHSCMFTTASWGAAQTTAYTSVSADADDIVFDHRIPWTNSMSNLGNQNVRPEAWAKNVISIGGLYHNNDANPNNDSWSNGASIGPAADGRLKPDLCNFYDNVWTSDLTAGGYSAGNSTTGFNGTSSATPITAGLNALAIQMYTDHIFTNPVRVQGGSRFSNRPYAQTLKALQITCASMYPIAQATRAQAGWGYGNVATMFNRRDLITIVPEDEPITQGATHTRTFNVAPGETSLKICMTFLDPQGNVAAAIDRINDLTLRVTSPGGTIYYGNNGLTLNNTSTSGGAANTIDTVENVFINNPAAGNWTVAVIATTIAQDGHVATAATDSTYALVVNGAREVFGSDCARYIPDNSTTGNENVIPFGATAPSTQTSQFAQNNGGSIGGAVFFDLAVTNDFYLPVIDVNTDIATGTALQMDVYYRAGTYAGNETNIGAWTAYSTAFGTAAGVNLPSQMQLNTPPLLFSGTTYGFALVARNFNHRYTNGNNTYTNANFTATFGAAQNVAFTSGPISTRTANVTLHYRDDQQSWNNQRYQTIVRAGELGAAGQIRGIAFSANNTGVHFNRELIVRMSHVPNGHVLSTTFATNLPSATTVLNRWNYSWHVTADGWQEIGFATPFSYNGTSDVVVDIYARGNHHSATPVDTFAGFNTGDQPRVYAYGWPWASSPATGSFGTGSGLRMRVNMGCAVGTSFGTSCSTMRAVPFGTPNLGGIAWFDCENGPANGAAVIGLGLATTYAPTSLTAYGFTNCNVYHDLLTTLFYPLSGSGFATHSISVPNNASFTGLTIHGQWFALDATMPGGLAASNHITNLIGIDP